MLRFPVPEINGRAEARGAALFARVTALARAAALVCRGRGAGHARRALRGAGDDHAPWCSSGWKRTARRAMPLSVALTERFIAVMECEHRELGLGDPTLGKTVRKLVGSLARADRAVARRRRRRRRPGSGGARQPVSTATRAAARSSIRRARSSAFWSSARASADLDDIAQGRLHMTDGFAHRLRLDQIRDGERLDLSADEAERRAIAERLGLPSIDRLEAHATLARKGRARPRRGTARRRARAKLRRHRRAGRRACRRAVRHCCSCPSPRPAARRGDRARRRGLRRRLLRRRGDRPRQRDRRLAGAQPRSLSAQRQRRSGAQGSRRDDAKRKRARSRRWPH